MAEITHERLRGKFANGDYSSATPEARKVVVSLGVKMDELDQRFRAIEKAIMEGMGKIQNARMAWSSNDDGGPGEGYTVAWEPALPEGLFPSLEPRRQRWNFRFARISDIPAVGPDRRKWISF